MNQDAKEISENATSARFVDVYFCRMLLGDGAGNTGKWGRNLWRSNRDHSGLGVWRAQKRRALYVVGSRRSTSGTVDRKQSFRH